MGGEIVQGDVAEPCEHGWHRDVPDGNNRGSEYFVTANEKNIRPYGILVKEM